MSVTNFLLALALVGVLLTSWQVVLTALLRKRARPFAFGPRETIPNVSPRAASTATTRLSILKPLSGLEDELEENLESFARLPLSYELILSVESAGDPAREVAERVIARNPGAPIRLVVGGGSGRSLVNPKVDRLVAAARHATGGIFLISDANVRASLPALLEVLGRFDDERVGIVSTPFVAAGAATLGARIEALHLLTFVLTGSVLAASVDIPCVVGKSMAVRRDLLDRAGGFEAFLGVLAEDQALGLAMKRLGFRVVLGSEVVENVVVSRPLGRALARQVRWNKLRFSFSGPLYLGELLLNPFGVSLLALASAVVAGPWESVSRAGFAVALVAVLRSLQALVLGRLTGARVSAVDAALMPLKDVLQLGAQVLPLLSKEVSWHGHRARLGPGTRLIPAAVS